MDGRDGAAGMVLTLAWHNGRRLCIRLISCVTHVGGEERGRWREGREVEGREGQQGWYLLSHGMMVGG